MNDKIMELLNGWHEKAEYQKIIDYVLDMPESERKYLHIGRLASAFNNVEEYDKAIEQLNLIKEEGKEDALWHFRMGYSFFYKGNFENAKKEFELAHKYDPDDEDAVEFLNMIREGVNPTINRNNEEVFKENTSIPGRSKKWESQ